MSLKPNYITVSDPAVAVKPRHIAYYEFGETENPKAIICVHGLSRNGKDFEFLAQALASKYRVLCPDMAGRGNSDWLADKSFYSYPTYLADIMALLGQLKISQADWIGTSMGGIIGMMLAAGQPHIIKRLILNDIGAVVSATGLKRILSYVGTSGIFANEEEALGYLKSIIAPFGISSVQEWQFMFEASFIKLPDGRYALRYDPGISQPFREAASKNEPVNDIDLSGFWNAVQCPALILRGGISDILTHETATGMCSNRANATLTEFPGIGHAPALLSEEQIKIITDWLDITSQC